MKIFNIKIIYLSIFLFLITVSVFAQNSKNESKFGTVKFSNKTDSSISVEYQPTGTQHVIFLLKSISVDFSTPALLDNLPKPENSIKIDSKEIENLKNYVLFEYNSGKPHHFYINGLKPETRYQIALYTPQSKKDKEKTEFIKFSTLAKEPVKQARIAAFGKIETNSITLILRSGSGDHRILIVKEKDTSDNPVDGIEYRPDLEFAKGEAINKSYVTYISVVPNEGPITISNLKPSTKYCFMACEANGKGEFTNYLTKHSQKTSSIIFKVTKLLPPVALPATNIQKTSFVSNWELDNNAMTYLLDVATDPDFNNILSDYKNVDVGVIKSFKIEDVPENVKEFYYRLRAIGESGESDFSDVIKVVM